MGDTNSRLPIWLRPLIAEQANIQRKNVHISSSTGHVIVNLSLGRRGIAQTLSLIVFFPDSSFKQQHDPSLLIGCTGMSGKDLFLVQLFTLGQIVQEANFTFLFCVFIAWELLKLWGIILCIEVLHLMSDSSMATIARHAGGKAITAHAPLPTCLT